MTKYFVTFTNSVRVELNQKPDLNTQIFYINDSGIKIEETLDSFEIDAVRNEYNYYTI